MRNLLPLFLDVTNRAVVLVGGGPVAAAKLDQLLDARAVVRVVSPRVVAKVESAVASGSATLARRPFVPSDLDGAWLAVAAASREVNQAVSAAAHARRIFVNAVDDPGNATAYLSGVVRRDGVTIAVSTAGDAPALTSLVREALDAVLPRDIGQWLRIARNMRIPWRRDRIPFEQRKPLLLAALNARYANAAVGQGDAGQGLSLAATCSPKETGSPKGLAYPEEWWPSLDR